MALPYDDSDGYDEASSASLPLAGGFLTPPAAGAKADSGGKQSSLDKRSASGSCPN